MTTSPTVPTRTTAPALTAFPMHGQHKLISEGYRTRDGHLIEWFGELLAPHGHVAVLSRPEPLPLSLRYRVLRGTVAPNTRGYPSTSVRMPNLSDRRKWWVTSLPDYRGFVDGRPTPVIAWNPFLSLSSAWKEIVASGQPLVFDLLDDWTIHYAFESVRGEVTEAYRRIFDHATAVTANSEATRDLARSFGRDDAQLVTNGCDPERFATTSLATGPTTVGYVGKIGRRVDLDLVLGVTSALPSVRFVFAGPILDAEYEAPLKRQPNIELLGDVHYSKVPALLQTFDIGWVPHRVGEGEVGGDVIKTYEYRAAWLPVITTPVLGASSRGLQHVVALPAAEHERWFADQAAQGPRVARREGAIPPEATWSGKARHLLSELGLG
ncbi:glycosyltransferase [Microbacterium sp. No. 7]|uniref:glycosyltransferase n=1 Tax=Microbacterium sp. No. 7 TaxID=1714373 RepID=UPI0006CF6943|nr:glycosyltransferase [Microbacterium sp. No. 7]ALJ19069.1 glycosyltransferase [Microbacterium sp. No. 7]